MSVQIQILHVGPASRSTRVPWLLEELGADVQKNVDLKQFSLLKPEEYRNDAFRSKYSTNSKFPVLVDDDLTLVEGPAINSYILRKFAPSSPLLPHNAKELAIYDSVNSFLVGHVDELVFNSVVESLMVPEDKRNVEFLTSSHKKFDEAVAFFERRLEKGQYIVSNTFTAADINLSVTLFFANLIGWLNTHPQLQEYLKRAISRPSWSKLKVEEGLKSLQG